MSASRIDLARTPDFDLGGVRVRPGRRQVCWGEGRCRGIEPRVMQVLVALASTDGKVVSRDRLIELCWGGRIVGDDAINRCIVALRHLAKGLAGGGFSIETVPRVGYYLVEKRAPPKRPHGLARRPARMAAALLLALGAAAILPFREGGGDRAEQSAPASIAVLPFRDVSGRDPYFAEGLGEEILGRLAGDPQFRVVGRTSSSMFRNAADVRDVGRKLGVSYVLEGSVRTEGGRVRVNTALVKTGDGMQIWAQSFEGRRDEIFAIQHRIGSEVALALRRKLVRDPSPDGPLATNGEVYSLYLAARGLLLTRKPSNMRAAADLLRRAVELDPHYAPAWSRLGAATGFHLSQEEDDRVAARQQEALRYVRHALALAPDLAEAHGTLGTLLGFHEGAPHIERAAQLDPNSAEILFWLGQVYRGRNEFAKQMAAYRRAARLDPLLLPLAEAGARLAVELGRRDEARAWAKRLFDGHPSAGRVLQGQLDFASGDFSGAVQRWSPVVAGSDADLRVYASHLTAETLRMFGMPHERLPRFGVQTLIRRSASRPPSPGEMNAWHRNKLVSDIRYAEILVGTKLLLKAGRHHELLGRYDSESGLLALGPKRRAQNMDLVDGGAVVALVLRRNGRGREADRLLARTDGVIRSALARGPVPFPFHAAAAQVWAVQGRRHEALAALERAAAAGWVAAGSGDLSDPADEPAFESLRGDPRFERVRAYLNRHFDRERSELRSLGY